MLKDILYSFEKAYSNLSLVELKKIQRDHDCKTATNPSMLNLAIKELISSLIKDKITY